MRHSTGFLSTLSCFPATQLGRRTYPHLPVVAKRALLICIPASTENSQLRMRLLSNNSHRILFMRIDNMPARRNSCISLTGSLAIESGHLKKPQNILLWVTHHTKNRGGYIMFSDTRSCTGRGGRVWLP